MATKGDVLTGARSRFSINGVKVGYATGVDVAEMINYEPLECLDNVEPEENVPTGYNIRLSASKFRIIGKTLKSDNFFPKVGNNTNEHLTNILTIGDLTATIEDTKSGRIYMTVEQVKVASVNWRVDARGVIGEQVDFVGIRVRDESEI